MKSVVIDGTNIQVSKFGFGTASLHHLISRSKRQKILGAAEKVGITHFDTSPYYGDGIAENELGIFLEGRRNGCTITTKVGLYSKWGTTSRISAVLSRKILGRIVPAISLPMINWSISKAQASLHQSIARMKCEYVDFLLLHEPSVDLIKSDEFLKWVESERSQGTIRSWGLAGEASQLLPWVDNRSPLGLVLQTKDSIKDMQANFILKNGRPLQFTYGYLSSYKGSFESNSLDSVLSAALARNFTGSIIISSRSDKRIAQIGALERKGSLFGS